MWSTWLNKDLWAIDSRITPVEGEYTLLKKRASSFHGVALHLNVRLRRFAIITAVKHEIFGRTESQICSINETLRNRVV